MADIKPEGKSIAQIKKDLLNPATTSHFLASIGLPTTRSNLLKKFQDEIALKFNLDQQAKLNLLVSQTALPGSRVLTQEIRNNFPGVRERHAYRRQFDDVITLTFYVDAEQYLPIRYFESWLNFITGSRLADDDGSSVDRPTFSHTMKFPDDYKGSLELTKFEKNLDFGGVGRTKIMTYKFVNVFPLAINSMPVSYNSSQLLRCSVGMAYSRYFVTQGAGGKVDSFLSTDDVGRDFDNSFFGSPANAEAFSEFTTNIIMDSRTRGLPNFFINNNKIINGNIPLDLA